MEISFRINDPFMMKNGFQKRVIPHEKQTLRTIHWNQITKIFREYGEEKHALKIAKRIEEERNIKPITTTFELVDIIDKCYPYKEKRNTHPAKKVFQALRIEVNNELGEFEKALKDSLEMLNPGGRVVVITFHSLEDRICKNIFKKVTEENEMVKGMPNIPKEMLPDYKLITKKPIIPSKEIKCQRKVERKELNLRDMK